MFTCFSKYNYIYVDNPTLRPFKPQFDALQLTPYEVGRLLAVFRSCDVDASGHISVHELFAHLATEATYFRDRVFKLFDEDGSGKIDFREFVLSLWNYCTLSKASLVIFAFDLYDEDSTGQLAPNEIGEMLRDLYGKQAETHPQAKLIWKELRALDAVTHINVDRFRVFVSRHPALLFPAFQMQLALRQHILGVRFWNRCAEKRIHLVDGRKVAIGDLTDLNIHENAYLEVLDAREKAMIEEEKRRKREADNSLIGWLSNKFASKKIATTTDVPTTHTNGRTSSTAENEANTKKTPSQLLHQPVLHPKDEMAMLIIQSTGTHHYRKAAAEHRQQQQDLLKERFSSHPIGLLGDINVLEEQYQTEAGQQYLMEIDHHTKHNANDLSQVHVHHAPTQLLRDHKFVGNHHASIQEKNQIASQMEEQPPKDDEEEVDIEELYKMDPIAAQRLVKERERVEKEQRHNLGAFERTMELVHQEHQLSNVVPKPAVDQTNLNKHTNKPNPSVVTLLQLEQQTQGQTPTPQAAKPATRFLGEITGKPVLSPRPNAQQHAHSTSALQQQHPHGHHPSGHLSKGGSRSVSPMVSPRNPHPITLPKRALSPKR